MSDLFSDLYRYRERERKNNYEDWLTECLAAILRALPAEAFSEFLSRLCDQPKEAILAIHPLVSIATQVTIPREDTGTQRPDLIVSIAAPAEDDRREPAQPWLVFENKVWHHVDEEELESGDIEGQLHRYGRWLQSQHLVRPGLQKSLVFVSHGTPVPAGFRPCENEHPAYRGLGRACSSWSAIARLLEETTGDFDASLHFRALICAYQAFLEEHGMAEDYPEYMDFATLANFVDIVDPFAKLVDEMLGKLEGLAPFQGRVIRAIADGEEGTYHAYRYMAPEPRYDGWTFISTGFWFPDRGEGFYLEDLEKQLGEAVSLSPKAYIQFANNEDDALQNIEGVPGEGWLRINSDFLIYRDVSDFPPAPADRAAAILSWAEEEGRKLKALIAA